MVWDADTIYRFCFRPRNDGSIDVFLRLEVDGGSSSGPLGWVTDATTIDAGPAALSEQDAAAVMGHLERAIELLGKAMDRAPSRDEERSQARDERDPRSSRPSELRLRR